MEERVMDVELVTRGRGSNRELGTEEIVAKQNEFITKLENTFNLWEASLDLDKLSLNNEKRLTSEPPKFHEFGVQTSVNNDLDGLNFNKLQIDSALKRSLIVPSVVITEPPPFEVVE